MRKLETKLKESQDNIVLRNLSVQQFYYFYNFLKEVLPVMNMIADKYEK